jgi:glycosyltransferase involved in cell wall biosynthesis
MKYTILIPCYNAEKYIDRCLNSLINQDHKDLEIIVLNDGSTDSSLNILNSYKEKDRRIKIISRENKGLSVTRNDLIREVNTDYFYFIDADD